jgi:hypothetical protein
MCSAIILRIMWMGVQKVDIAHTSNMVEIDIKVRTAAFGEEVSADILALPELKPYKVQLRVHVKP